LKEFLIKKQTVIIKKWKEAIADTYPSETAEFLKTKREQFTNPLGHSISQGVEKLYEGLINEIGREDVEVLIDPIVRIRAVQDFVPSQAAGFMFLLKNIIRQEIGAEIHKKVMADNLLILESQIDDFALASFDVFMKCREKIFEIKTDEIRKRSLGLLNNPKMIAFLQKRGDFED
jgi:hypothetical protein